MQARLSSTRQFQRPLAERKRALIELLVAHIPAVRNKPTIRRFLEEADPVLVELQ